MMSQCISWNISWEHGSRNSMCVAADTNKVNFAHVRAVGPNALASGHIEGV